MAWSQSVRRACRGVLAARGLGNEPSVTNECPSVLLAKGSVKGLRTSPVS